MVLALAARKDGGEIRTGGRKFFAHHVVADRFDGGDASLFLRGQIMIPIGLEKKFIQVDQTHPIGASTAFVPAGFEKDKVRVEVRFGGAFEGADLDLGRSVQKLDRTIGGTIVVNDDAIDERLIVPEEEWDNAFLVPAGGVEVDGHEDGSRTTEANAP